MTAGDYQATVKYLENGQWLAVPEGEASHTISFKVSGNGIGENSDLTMLPYPNPTADKLYLQLPEKSTVSLTDASGKLLFQAEMQGEEVCIDLSGYSNGIYLLRILSADGKQRAYTCRKR